MLHFGFFTNASGPKYKPTNEASCHNETDEIFAVFNLPQFFEQRTFFTKEETHSITARFFSPANTLNYDTI